MTTSYRPRLFPGFAAAPTLAVALVTVLAACDSTPQSGMPNLAPAGGTVRGIDDLVLVDCLLPGQIRQLGTRMTFVAPRRHVKATKSDCAIRGGEIVLFDRSDYTTALATLMPKAQGGDPVAQTYVGEIFEKGLGLPAPDYAAAALWYRKAAESGHRPAQTNLGTLYERGLGVPKNKAEALNWYRKATGVIEDPLIFESKLKAERATFQRELALRKSLASSLRQKLDQARRASATVAAPRPQIEQQELERAATNLRQEAASAAAQTKREIEAIEAVSKAVTESEGSSQPAPPKTKIEPQRGKLELSLRQRQEEFQELQAFVTQQARLGSPL